MDLEEWKYEGVDWIQLTQDRIQCQVHEHSNENLGYHKRDEYNIS
jgi:hypothetical protein